MARMRHFTFNCYDALGLKDGENSLAAIKLARRHKAIEAHPDKHMASDDATKMDWEEEIKRINLAFDLLSTEEGRRDHDAWLRSARSGASANPFKQPSAEYVEAVRRIDEEFAAEEGRLKAVRDQAMAHLRAAGPSLVRNLRAKQAALGDPSSLLEVARQERDGIHQEADTVLTRKNSRNVRRVEKGKMTSIDAIRKLMKLAGKHAEKKDAANIQYDQQVQQANDLRAAHAEIDRQLRDHSGQTRQREAEIDREFRRGMSMAEQRRNAALAQAEKLK